MNVSSMGGLRYLFNVAYGVGKAACDRMAADCGIELKGSNVAMVSLWPGPVRYVPVPVLYVIIDGLELARRVSSCRLHNFPKKPVQQAILVRLSL